MFSNTNSQCEGAQMNATSLLLAVGYPLESPLLRTCLSAFSALRLRPPRPRQPPMPF